MGYDMSNFVLIFSEQIFYSILILTVFYTFNPLNMLKSPIDYLFFSEKALVNGSNIAIMNKFALSGLFSVTVGLLIHCSEVVLTERCEPVVVFSGYINGDYMNLSGNCHWKNQCKYNGDTLGIYFYSEDFREVNNIRDGDFFRLHIYPGDGQLLGIGRILFHMARYHEKNSSYTVSPADTLFGRSVAKMQMQTVAWDSILIDNIYVRCPPVSGTYGETLEIREGKIQGVIQ